jgi:hypothetical protein
MSLPEKPDVDDVDDGLMDKKYLKPSSYSTSALVMNKRVALSMCKRDLR